MSYRDYYGDYVGTAVGIHSVTPSNRQLYQESTEGRPESIESSP